MHFKTVTIISIGVICIFLIAGLTILGNQNFSTVISDDSNFKAEAGESVANDDIGTSTVQKNKTQSDNILTGNMEEIISNESLSIEVTKAELVDAVGSVSATDNKKLAKINLKSTNQSTSDQTLKLYFFNLQSGDKNYSAKNVTSSDLSDAFDLYQHLPANDTIKGSLLFEIDSDLSDLTLSFNNNVDEVIEISLNNIVISEKKEETEEIKSTESSVVNSPSLQNTTPTKPEIKIYQDDGYEQP